MTIPSIFISHGAPDLVLQNSEASQFLQEFSNSILPPKAIVIASAHHEASGVKIVNDPLPETLYDFGGFAPEMYELIYPAKGNPELAKRVSDLLAEAGINSEMDSNRGFDHGVWSPLMLIWPEANIPIVQVSIDPSRDAKYHYDLGKALAPLREDDVLVIGSGHITHNLQVIFSALRQGVENPDMVNKVGAFTDWFYQQFESGNVDKILDWKDAAPYSTENHPTDEHLMPLFFAYGAGSRIGNAENSNGKAASAKRLHSSTQIGMFKYEVYKFD